MEREDITGKGNEASNEELLKAVQALQKELYDLKRNNKPQVASMSSNDGGMIKQLVDELKKKTDKEKYESDSGYVEEADIEPEDYDEAGAIFFAFSTGYVIVDDVRRGMRIPTPYRDIIFFKYQSTIKTGNGKYTNVSNCCSYVSHSKKTTEWLKKHSKYGQVFFDKQADALNVDAAIAIKLAQYSNALGSMELHQIVMKCKSEDVPVSDNIEAMRSALAHKWAKDELHKEKEANTIKAMMAREEDVFSPRG